MWASWEHGRLENRTELTVAGWSAAPGLRLPKEAGCPTAGPHDGGLLCHLTGFQRLWGRFAGIQGTLACWYQGGSIEARYTWAHLGIGFRCRLL